MGLPVKISYTTRQLRSLPELLCVYSPSWRHGLVTNPQRRRLNNIRARQCGRTQVDRRNETLAYESTATVDYTVDRELHGNNGHDGNTADVIRGNTAVTAATTL